MHHQSLSRLIFCIVLAVSSSSFAQKDEIHRMADSLQYLSGPVYRCSQDVIWRLASKKLKAIPYLIEMLADTTPTKAYFPCLKKNIPLDVGGVAYCVIEFIIDVPVGQIFSQYCISDDSTGCWSFYADIFQTMGPELRQSRFRNWYVHNKKHLKWKKERFAEQYDCVRKYLSGWYKTY